MSIKETTLEQRVGEILFARDQESGHLHRCAACGEIRGFTSLATMICEACDVALQGVNDVIAHIS